MKKRPRLGVLLAALALTLVAADLTHRPAFWLFPFEPFAHRLYRLPDPLVTNAGKPVTDVDTWRTVRRPEILELFRSQVYGRMPGRPAGMTFNVFDQDRAALGGKAVRKQVRINFTADPNGPGMDLLLYLPAHASRPVPVFLSLNFRGNHAVNADPAIRLPGAWIKQSKGVVENHADEIGRGTHAYRFPVEHILARGYGLATIYYGDLDPDFDDGFKNGVQGAFDGPGPRPADAWGSIAAWAWGLSRGLDYLETDPEVDAKRVMTAGHSRLGKTALWAAAEDQRFAGAFATGSGCMGGAIGRRMIGENIADINRRFGYWFCENFHQYNFREYALPVDQHELLALIAPRPVYLGSAEQDIWSDPIGEFAAVRAAAPVFDLLGAHGDHGAFPFKYPPALHSPQMGAIGFHIRAGQHDILAYDWECFMDFADRRVK
jgi:hypothetical protein